MAEPSEPLWSLIPAAEQLSERHQLSGKPPAPIDAWSKLAVSERWLQETRLACLDAPPDAGKAAEWLLDNDYQVYRALRQIRQDLPPSFYDRLPALAQGDGAGMPRIFAIAHDLLRVTRLQVSLPNAVRFVRAYQPSTPLTIAELWAFPTMLRIACIEILGSALGPLLNNRVAMPFALTAWATDPHSLDATERVARAIANLGVIAAISWEEFFDATSRVEEILGEDPAGFYSRMDFETRDRYRHAVEELARYGTAGEVDIATEAVGRATVAGQGEVQRHVGYWLVGEGRREFERLQGARLPLDRRWQRRVLQRPGLFYMLAMAISGVGTLIVPAIYLAAVGAGPLGWIAGLIVTQIPASVLAMTFVHWAITQFLPPRVLNKLDCRAGLPRDSRTIIVVPVVIAAPAEAAKLVEQIETHWLANADPMLQVALLADFADAPEEHMPVDGEIEQLLASEIRRLNQRHGGSGRDPFHLLLRPRLYNPGQRCWMAWERKRGKLEQFNLMLVEDEDSAFSIHIGQRAALANIRFVVTVDADTMLPPGSVGKLVGTLAHPLNQARTDPETGRIIAGYSIIQPRVEISPHCGTRTWFARLFTGDTAIDIYSRAVSDVYQDLFGAGIFVGKGIYDLHAFHLSLEGRVPENRILSHDLFEGAHGRIALATDIVLYEGFPTSYLEYSRRLHRWIRGDWQLLAWLWPKVPAADGKRLPNRLAGIDRWKIVDNLRRSLVAPGLLLLALAGWFILPGNPWFWTLLVVFALAGQLFTDIVSGLARGRRRGAAYGILSRVSDQAGRQLLAIVYLLHEALLSLHAIGVTLWRMFVSHRNMLEWTSAAHVAARASGQNSRAGIWRQMWLAPAIVLVITAGLPFARPGALAAALPLLILWLAAPEITFRIGRPRKIDTKPFGAGDTEFLRHLARKTWLYFETFAGPEDSWLPPDNYQGVPHEEIAHRTSPTNIGMMLLSTATAWDLGYLGRPELAARTRNIFESLDRLERYRGHFYNWYDTLHLKPLEPRYVSAVDSGNLAVSLVVYAEALRDAATLPAIEAQRWNGLVDVFELLEEATTSLAEDAADIPDRLVRLCENLKILENNPQSWRSGLDNFCDVELPAFEEQVAQAVESRTAIPVEALRDLDVWLDRLGQQARSMRRDLTEPVAIGTELRDLADQAIALAYAMDFKPLYDKERRLFYIGHNVSSGRTDTHHYDLLASEARLASFFAIAKGDVPIEHWFHLERPVTRANGGLALMSWNGSMFEYLMPRLVLRSEPDTLLGESERIAVEIQRRYGTSRDIPWGVSESAYSSRDPEHRYRYQAFGVPALGLRRSLGRDMVVAPYASALALTVAPGHAADNLRMLAKFGASGRYGLLEAIDLTPERLDRDVPFKPVDAYMAHHQGMILCAIGNAINDDILVRRFGRDPRIRLNSLLLSERVPREVPAEIKRLDELDKPRGESLPARMPSAWQPARAPFPQVQLLGNGRFASWISAAGGGALRWRGNALTRFVPDATLDADGLWIYLADEDSGNLWSATRQPTGAIPDESQTVFHPHLAEFHRRDHEIDLRLEVGVAAGDDLEIRRLAIANESDRPRRLRLTSYGEVVLAPPLEDERHPAFSKLFVGGEYLPGLGGMLFTRRPRSPHDAPPVLLHFAIGSDGPLQTLRYETDRRAFIGRGGNLRDPAGARAELSCTSGWTLDPVMALQQSIELQPYEHREICFVTVAAPTREAAIEIAERHATLSSVDWILSDAASEISRAVERSRLDPDTLDQFQTLASLLVYPHGALRSAARNVRRNRLGQASLWGMAISGDLPILLLRTGTGGASLLDQLVGAHQLWRRQGLEVDLVILQTGGSAYVEPMRDDVMELLRDLGASDMLGRNGGIHLLFADQIGVDQARLLGAAAWVVLDESRGTLAEQIGNALKPAPELPQFIPSLPRLNKELSALARPDDLLFDNGFGGFTPDGREYVIHIEAGETTPAPWSNILANDQFGCLVTEAGGSFSWAVNSGENRLTPWTNDPVTDRPGESLYMRDEETAAIWSVTPSPAGGDAGCQIRHGAGYSEWHSRSHGLDQEMRVFVPTDAPVKIIRLRIRNPGDRHRRLTSTYYAEWLLGALPSIARRHVHCDYDASSHAILAANIWNADFADRVAFLTANSAPHGFTTDRQEFIGREGDQAKPAALERWGLSGKLVGGEDACAAYQVHIDLAAGETAELVFVLGQGQNRAEAKALAARWSDPEAVEKASDALARHWDDILGAVEVRTPDPAFDTIMNRWLIYQSLSSRVLARTGFYQASGAIGFRDQLQDVLAFLHSDPARTRAHILLSAEHQFEEGDVLHWWHPPSDRGVRTRCSDDLLWLPYAVATYVRATGDLSILDEELSFLDAPPLASEEEDRYARFEPTSIRYPLIDHCERALEHALTRGVHGLPLIGSGDWNDGMDRVGRAGRGESVWLAWFAAVTADLVADLYRRLGRDHDGDRWAARADELRGHAEEAGWDGEWYRRAYDDEGQPLGSAQNDECRIDSISQSWAAFAGADPARVAQALDSAQRELVNTDDALARLLWPPFDRTFRDPGYIKAYPPGIRENGGQYSHAAAWLGLAFTELGRSEAAFEIFNMLNPIHRAKDREQAEHYRVEPYVAAGDIGAVGPHRGKGGWTWYTGSAAWTWRLGIEGILGLHLVDGRLHIAPCIPPSWGGYEVVFRRAQGSVSVRVEDPDGLGRGEIDLTIDGQRCNGAEADLPVDGAPVSVVARLKK